MPTVGAGNCADTATDSVEQKLGNPLKWVFTSLRYATRPCFLVSQSLRVHDLTRTDRMWTVWGRRMGSGLVHILSVCLTVMCTYLQPLITTLAVCAAAGM